MTTNIRHCARCDGDHDNLEIKQLHKPVIGGDLEIIASYWTICPTTGEPILIYVSNDEAREAI